MVSLMSQLYITGGDVFFFREVLFIFCFFLGFCWREMRNDILLTEGSKCDGLRNEKQKKKERGGRRGNFFFFNFRGRGYVCPSSTLLSSSFRFWKNHLTNQPIQ